MKIQATPYHRMLASLLGIVLLGCYSFALFLFRQPLHVLIMMIPPLICAAVVYIPYYRDHQGVTYEIAEQAILLWRNNQIHRSILFEDIASVRNMTGSILLRTRKRGFWQSGECLHPLSDSDAFAQAIEDKLQKKGTRVTSK